MVYKRLSVWNLKRPSNPAYYKKTKVFDYLTGKEKEVCTPFRVTTLKDDAMF